MRGPTMIRPALERIVVMPPLDVARTASSRFHTFLRVIFQVPLRLARIRGPSANSKNKTVKRYPAWYANKLFS
jgi:hypothetical protein